MWWLLRRSLDKARETVDKLHLTFPVAYGLEVPRDAEKVGAFWEERRKNIHATNFILDSDKKVCDASYSIGPIGRIVAADALSHIQFFKRERRNNNRRALRGSFDDLLDPETYCRGISCINRDTTLR
jgi:hypothetical protein